jgi:hypothetical protein
LKEQEWFVQEAIRRFGRDDTVFLLYVRKGRDWMIRTNEFERERHALRTDYLIRGICEREVDGLLEDVGLYTCYVPKEFRFSYLYQLASIGEGVQRVLGVKEMLDFSAQQWRLFLLFLQEECAARD